MSTISDLHHMAAVAVQPGLRKSRMKNAMRKASSAFATVLVIVVVAALLFLAIGPRLLGYQTSTVLSGSMAPLINAGDVVFIVPVPVDAIEVGDVITYDIPVEDRRTVTHRVAEIVTDADGASAIRSKGDANIGRDYWVAVLDGPNVLKHVFTIPYLGTVIRTLRQPPILNTLLYGAPALLGAWFIVSMWRKPAVLEAETANGGALASQGEPQAK